MQGVLFLSSKQNSHPEAAKSIQKTMDNCKPINRIRRDNFELPLSMNHPKPHPAVLTNTPIDSEIKITALANGFTYAIRLDDLAATVLTGNYDLPAYIAYFGKVVLMLCSGEMSISPTDQSHYPIISDNIEEDAVAFLHPSDVEELEEAVTFINVTDIRSTTQEEALNASSASFFGKRIISSPEIH